MPGVIGALVVVLAITACSADEADTATGTDPAGITSTSVSVTTTVAATTSTALAPDTVDIENFAFIPDEITVSAGTTVTWRNLTASTTHTVTSPDESWPSRTLAAGDSFSVTFDEPGTYGYFCTIHQSMVGTVEVVDR